MRKLKPIKKKKSHQCTYEDPITDKRCKKKTIRKYFCTTCLQKVVDVVYY